VYRGGPRRNFRPADAWYTALVCGPALALRFFNLSRFLGILVRGGGQ
jgi:hypothetical protein